MKRKKIVSILLTAALSVSMLTGCGGSDDESSVQSSSSAEESSSEDSSEESSDEAESSSDVAEDVSWYETVETLDNPDVTIALYWEPDTEEQAAIDDFEAKYGGTVTVIVTGWNKVITTLQEYLATGDNIDLGFTEGQYFYSNLLDGYFQPIDEYLDESICDSASTDLFEIQDQHYVFTNAAINTPYFVYYNKSMIEEAGLTDPVELYNNGEWTYAKFLEYWEYFNQDTDGDGELDQWGLGNRAQRIDFGIANGSRSVQEVGNGQLTAAIDSDKMIEYFDMLNTWGTLAKASETTTGIYGRQFAMEEEAGMGVTSDNGDEIDFVPLPTADGSQCVTPVWDHGYALLTGAANPEGAAVLASMICAYKLDSYYDNLEATYTEEQQERILSVMTNITYGKRNYPDVTTNYGESDALSGSPAQTLIETYKSQLEAEIEAFNAKVVETMGE